LLNENDVQFEHQDYKNIVSNKNDVVYLDPPYAGTKGMYYGTIDYDDLWNWIEVQKGFVVLSFDGKTTTHEYDTNIVPNIRSHFLCMECVPRKKILRPSLGRILFDTDSERFYKDKAYEIVVLCILILCTNFHATYSLFDDPIVLRKDEFPE